MVVNTNKTNLIFQGQGYLNTAIAWNDTANSTGGTSYSSSVAIFAVNFTAYNISFEVTDVVWVMLTKKETIYNYIYVLNIDTHKESWKHTKLIKLIAFFVNLIRNHGYFIWSVILMLDTCWILDTSRTLLYACSNCVLFLKLKKKMLDIVRTQEQEELNTLHKTKRKFILWIIILHLKINKYLLFFIFFYIQNRNSTLT